MWRHTHSTNKHIRRRRRVTCVYHRVNEFAEDNEENSSQAGRKGFEQKLVIKSSW
jgi:hypothetical protein